MFGRRLQSELLTEAIEQSLAVTLVNKPLRSIDFSHFDSVDEFECSMGFFWKHAPGFSGYSANRVGKESNYGDRRFSILKFTLTFETLGEN